MVTSLAGVLYVLKAGRLAHLRWAKRISRVLAGDIVAYWRMRIAKPSTVALVDKHTYKGATGLLWVVKLTHRDQRHHHLKINASYGAAVWASGGRYYTMSF